MFVLTSPFNFISAFGAVKEIALRQATDHIDRLEKKNRMMTEAFEKSRKDADDCHRSASTWKTRFMKLRSETEKCATCKPVAASVLSK